MEKVKQYFIAHGGEYLLPKIHEFSGSSATSELAAQQLGCTVGMIAKSLTFTLVKKKDGTAYQPLLILAAGDVKVSTNRYREKFGRRPEMIKREDVETVIGFPAGGVCPFGVFEGVKVYLDASLRRFPCVYPACGTSRSGIPLTIAELERFSGFVEWVDVCDGWREGETVKESHDLTSPTSDVASPVTATAASA